MYRVLRTAKQVTTFMNFCRVRFDYVQIYSIGVGNNDIFMLIAFRQLWVIRELSNFEIFFYKWLNFFVSKFMPLEFCGNLNDAYWGFYFLPTCMFIRPCMSIRKTRVCLSLIDFVTKLYSRFPNKWTGRLLENPTYSELYIC